MCRKNFPPTLNASSAIGHPAAFRGAALLSSDVERVIGHRPSRRFPRRCIDSTIDSLGLSPSLSLSSSLFLSRAGFCLELHGIPNFLLIRT